MTWSRKEDVKLVLYDDSDMDYDFPITVHISNKDYESEHKIYYNEIMFKNELDDLDIRFEDDEWVCFDPSLQDRDRLKVELETRGFLVIMSEDY